MAIEQVGIEVTLDAGKVYKQLSEIESIITAINKAKVEISIDITDIANAQKALNELHDTMVNLGKSNFSIGKSVDTDGLTNAEKILSRLDTELDSLNKTKVALQVQADQIHETQDAVVRLQDRLEQLSVQQTKINVSTNLDEIGGRISGFGDKLLSVFNPLSSRIGSLVSGLSVFTLLDKAVNTISTSLDGAISRFDTLNNYPKVLSYLGYTTDEAANAINKLSDASAGLPTPLNELVSTSQQIVGITGNLDKATNLTLALNNAFLANGASTQDAVRGTTQFLRTLSNGEVDIVRWQSLAQTMPVALELIAQEFGYTEDGANQLYKALDKGTISFDSFVDKLIEVGTESGTLAEAARANAIGLRTSLANIGTQITRGLANVISAFDDTSKRLTGKTLSENLNSVRQAVIDTFAFIIPQIEKLDPYIEKAINKFKQLQDTLKNFAWGEFWEGLKEGFSGLKEAFSGFVEVAKPALSFLKDLITQYGGGSFAKGLGKLPADYIKLAVGLKVFGKALQFLGKYTNVSLPSFLGGKKNKGGNTVFNFDVAKSLNQLKNLTLIYGYVKVIQELAQALQDIDKKVPTNIAKVGQKLANMGLALAGIGALAVAVGAIAKLDYKAAAAGLIGVAGLSLNLILAAEALKQINTKVPSNLARVSGKLLALTLALGSMTAIFGIATAIAKIGGLPYAIAGLGIVTGLVLELMLVAEALKQFDDKVPEDIGNFSSKVANMAIALGALGGIVAVVGGLVSSGVGALVGAAGLLGITAFALELILVAEAIKQFDDKVPNDLSGVIGKIESLAEVLEAFSKATFTDITKLFSDFLGVVDIAVITQGIDLLIVLAGLLEELGQIKISKKGIANIEEMLEALSVFDGSDLESLVGNFIFAVDATVIASSLDVLIAIGEQLEHIGQFDFRSGNVRGNIQAIKDTITEVFGADSIFSVLAKSVNNTFDPGYYKNALKSMVYIQEIGGQLETLGGYEIDTGKVEAYVKSIEDCIRIIGNSSFVDLVGKFIGVGEAAAIFETLKIFVDLIEPLNQLGNANIDAGTARRNINNILFAIESLGNAKLEDFAKQAIEVGTFMIVVNTLDVLLDMLEPLQQLASISFDPGSARRNINNLLFAIEPLGNNTLTDFVTQVFEFGTIINIISTLEALIDMTEPLNTLATIEVDYGQARRNINNIIFALEAIDGARLNEWFGAMLKVSQLESIIESIDIYIQIAHKLNELAEIDFKGAEIIRLINSIDVVLTQMSEFPTLGDVDSIYEFVNGFRDMAEALNGLQDEFYDIGENYGQNLIRGFKSAKVPNEIAKIIEETITKLKEKTPKFQEVGKQYGEALVKGFAEAIKQMGTAVDNVLNSLIGYTSRFSGLGTAYGNSLSNSFSSAVSGLSNSIATQVNSIQRSLNSLTVPQLKVNVQSSTPAGYVSTGGEVPQYFSNGGHNSIFKPKGTDTVPAMLTPGEYVQRKQAVQRFGVGFMEKVNNLDIAGAYHSLVGRFHPESTTQNSQVQNINNNNHIQTTNATINQHISRGDQNYSMRRVNRALVGRA